MIRFLRARRRQLLLALTLLLGLLIYSVFIEPARIGFTTHEIEIAGLPPRFDGFKIVQISDLHVNRWLRPDDVRALVARVNTLHPDMVVLTGDFVSRNRADCEPAGEALAGLKAKHGVYAVLGNHDYWTDAEAVTKALRSSGVDVLFDENRRITIGDESIRLVGTDDCWEGDPDYEKAFRGVSEKDTCIAIAHNPDAVMEMESEPVRFLMSGHTHGGLIRLPFIGPLLTNSHLGRRNSSGMLMMNGITAYVSRGIGSGPIAHIRFRCPPEVPVFVLTGGRGSLLHAPS